MGMGKPWCVLHARSCEQAAKTGTGIGVVVQTATFDGMGPLLILGESCVTEDGGLVPASNNTGVFQKRWVCCCCNSPGKRDIKEARCGPVREGGRLQTGGERWGTVELARFASRGHKEWRSRSQDAILLAFSWSLSWLPRCRTACLGQAMPTDPRSLGERHVVGPEKTKRFPRKLGKLVHHEALCTQAGQLGGWAV
jgi:hypothetical protein